MALKRKRSIDASELENVFRSAPIKDRDSRFIGYFSPTMKPQDLQKLVEIQSASHRILGSRHKDKQQSITGETRYVTEFKDDGEQYAGRRIIKVLEESQTTGACVVARWYGGINLGQVRFAHIVKCAEGAIESWRSHQKAVNEKDERKKLLKTLVEMDKMISDLRLLRSVKNQELQAGKSVVPDSVSTSPAASQTPTRLPDYSTLPLEKLRMLDKSRSASLQHLIAAVDNAYAELADQKTPPTSGPL
jgi:putative IMPACT (imprinted ancient) family translation regulator